MFGARLKSWVEAHLGKARKRKQKTSKVVKEIIPTNIEMENSSKRNTNLSSPESAYSTGYSTDGTSPSANQTEIATVGTRRKIIIQPAAPQIIKPSPISSPSHCIISHNRSESISKWSTPSPRRRCRIRTNPWVNSTVSPMSHRKHQISNSPRRNLIYSVKKNGFGDSSDEEIGNKHKYCNLETDILSDDDDEEEDDYTCSDGDTGLDGGDEEESSTEATSGRRRTRRRSQWRRAPLSASPTPLRNQRRTRTNSANRNSPRDPFLDADREAEVKYRDLIREAERLLAGMVRVPQEPPHNPRVRLLRESDICGRPNTPSSHYNSPERKQVNHFMKANPPELFRKGSVKNIHDPRRTLVKIAPHLADEIVPQRSEDRPQSEPPKRKAYKDAPERNQMLVKTLQDLKINLMRQSVFLSTQTRSFNRLNTLHHGD